MHYLLLESYKMSIYWLYNSFIALLKNVLILFGLWFPEP
jgi:hypothetical protein